MTKSSKLTLERVLPYILLVGSIVGLIVGFALTYDKLQVLHNPSYKPSCNLNPVLSCGSVMKSSQANLFGLPNTIYGLMGFSALLTVAGLLLMGVKLPRKAWLGIEAGVTAGLAFTLYLFFQGVFRIHAICPFCFLVWLAMPPVFWYTTLYNIQQRHIRVRAGLREFLLRHHGDILVVWYLIFFGILLVKFWYYWSTLI